MDQVEVVLRLSGNLRGSGQEPTPLTVTVGDLAKILVPFERAIVAAAGGGRGLGLALLGHEAGSSRPRLAVPAALLPGLRAVCRAAVEGAGTGLPPKATRALAQLRRQSARLGVAVTLVGEPTAGLPEVCLADPAAPPPPAELTEQTTVYGRLLAIGGAGPRKHATLALREGGNLHVALDETLARQLAPRLFEVVALEGRAVWDLGTWTLRRFQAELVLPYTETAASAAFEALREVVGDAFAGIDPDAWIRQVRGGGGA
ncbi:MAG: hypothetical protein IT204_17350 [Fimbriimonadaceae bacterium]|nr:hypothetical protein [Fimbriimonadaceae bacterium]